MSDETNLRAGQPVLVCRWRLAHKTVPLFNRHIRALARRRIDGVALSMNLVAWAKQHIEWAVAEDAYHDHDGVLMLVVDDAGQAVMSTGAYEPLADVSPAALATRAAEARREAAATGVAPEVLCALEGDVLKVATAPGESASGVLSLVEQLVATKGAACQHVLTTPGNAPTAPELLEALGEGALMLVSDEHGVVACTDMAEACAPLTPAFFADAYARLLAR